MFHFIMNFSTYYRGFFCLLADFLFRKEERRKEGANNTYYSLVEGNHGDED